MREKEEGIEGREQWRDKEIRERKKCGKECRVVEGKEGERGRD